MKYSTYGNESGNVSNPKFYRIYSINRHPWISDAVESSCPKIWVMVSLLSFDLTVTESIVLVFHNNFPISPQFQPWTYQVRLLLHLRQLTGWKAGRASHHKHVPRHLESSAHHPHHCQQMPCCDKTIYSQCCCTFTLITNGVEDREITLHFWCLFRRFTIISHIASDCIQQSLQFWYIWTWKLNVIITGKDMSTMQMKWISVKMYLVLRN